MPFKTTWKSFVQLGRPQTTIRQHAHCTLNMLKLQIHPENTLYLLLFHATMVVLTILSCLTLRYVQFRIPYVNMSNALVLLVHFHDYVSVDRGLNCGLPTVRYRPTACSGGQSQAIQRQRTGSFRGPGHERFVMDKVALEQVTLRVPRSSLSLSFCQCSTFIHSSISKVKYII